MAREGRRRTPNPSFAPDSALPRINSRRSGLFLIADNSVGLATPSTFSCTSTGQEPPPAGTHLSPARDPFSFVKGIPASSLLPLHAHAHHVRASTASVEHALATLHVELVVTAQPLVNLTGLISRRCADDPLLLSSRSSFKPIGLVGSRLMGAGRAPSGDVSPTYDDASQPVAVSPASFLASATQCPQRAALCAPIMPFDGSAPSVFDPTNEYSLENVVLLGSPPSFSHDGHRRLLSTMTFRIPPQSGTLWSKVRAFSTTTVHRKMYCAIGPSTS